jgi:branched-subunit amino acid transport protein
VNVWLLILGVGLGSLLLRASVLVLARDRNWPQSVTASLGLVPAAVLAALIAPELLYAPSTGAFDPGGPRLVAGVIAALVAWKTRDVLWTLVSGLGLLLAFQALGWH